MGRDKILILFVNKKPMDEDNVVQQIFGNCLKDRILTNEDHIVKDLTWSTKYYDAKFDLYIDQCNSFEKWYRQFNHPECKPLKRVLAGLIIIDKMPTEDPLIVAELEVDKETFSIWCHNNNDMTDEELTSYNLAVMKADLPIEFVQLDNTTETNEFDETIGIARIKEIIDTYEWPNLIKKYVPKGDRTPSYRSDDLETIWKQMRIAKLEYESQKEKISDSLGKLTKGEMDPDQFAKNFADEIADQLTK